MLAIAINLVLLSVNSAILPCFLASASAIALASLSLLATASLLSSIAHTSLPSSLRASAERVYLRVQQTRLYRNWFNYSVIRLLLRVRLTHSRCFRGTQISSLPIIAHVHEPFNARIGSQHGCSVVTMSFFSKPNQRFSTVTMKQLLLVPIFRRLYLPLLLVESGTSTRSLV